MNNKTPITDAAEYPNDADHVSWNNVVNAKVARKLEIQLTLAKEKLLKADSLCRWAKRISDGFCQDGTRHIDFDGLDRAIDEYEGAK